MPKKLPLSSPRALAITKSRDKFIAMDMRTVLRVNDELSHADNRASSTDGWTSKATQSYNTVAADFNWELKCYVLQTRPFLNPAQMKT